MTLPAEVEARLAEIARTLVTEETLAGSLHRVADGAVAMIPDCDLCSVSLAQGSGKVTVGASTSAVAERVDDLQHSAESGPCVEAIRTGEAVRVPSMAEERRWPAFVSRAVTEGLVSSYSVPLTVATRPVGALNLYSQTRAFSDASVAVSQGFASHAAVALANAQAYHQAQELIGHLEEALKSRDVIGQAKGIIMERTRCTAQQAFDVLRSVSQARNVKLRDIADQVVTTGTWEDEPTSAESRR